MNKQEVFNKAWEFLIAQGYKSTSSCGRCEYNGDNGRHCAIGLFATPEEAERLNMFMNVSQLGDRLPAALKGIDMEFLRRLQGCHDGAMDSHFVPSFKMLMLNLAEEYDLAVPREPR
jgi:hypothetical protein